LPKAQDEIVHPIFVEVSDDRSGLLSRGARHRQIARIAREMSPLDIRGVESADKAEND
jgi:hypothetical protein